MSITGFLPLLSAVLLASSSVWAASCDNEHGCEIALRDTVTVLGCNLLKLVFPTKVFSPGESVYAWETQDFWSNTELLNPACVFRPTCASDVSAAILANQLSQTQFAVRGGGHMGIKGANNIDNGMLIVMSNLTTLNISADYSTVDIGPGLRWGEVYAYVAQYDRAVGGGRLSPVGVPGLLLAGGVNFYGNQHGWSADNVLEYEVVLASGLIVTVNRSSYTDLFWALKGGSSNFGIVTKFTMRTFPSTQVYAGVYSVAGSDVPAFLDAVANYSAFNTDPLSHIVPMVIPVNPNTTVASVILFYDSPTVSNPACFAPFFAIPAISSSMGFQTVSEFAIETGALVTPGINDIFFAGTVVGKTYAELQAAVTLTNNLFFAALPTLYDAVPVDDLVLVSIDWQPIGTLWASGSAASNPTGNVLGVDPASKGTYLAWAGVVEWKSSQYDDVIMAWVQNTSVTINNAAQAAGLFDAFNYMGDSTGFQDVFDGYGEANKAQLLATSQKYDPLRVFQTLMPGGFKIGR